MGEKSAISGGFLFDFPLADSASGSGCQCGPIARLRDGAVELALEVVDRLAAIEPLRSQAHR